MIAIVTIIIPCYNASEFISDTLKSILSQKNVGFEIIVVDDGSSDGSKNQIFSFKDDRIKYYYQKNKGVSSARNYGLLEAKGEYVIFFDADDLMSENFIATRVEHLQARKLDFICGPVKKMVHEKIEAEPFRGTSSNLVEEILYYDKSVITCPSNYLFKRIFLINNKLDFNESLASTADKFFLLCCSKYGSSDYEKECSPLFYRINENSMSHKITKGLVKDNEQFYYYLKNGNHIPWKNRKSILAIGYYILAGANYSINNYIFALYFATKSLVLNPNILLKKLKNLF